MDSGIDVSTVSLEEGGVDDHLRMVTGEAVCVERKKKEEQRQLN